MQTIDGLILSRTSDIVEKETSVELVKDLSAQI